MFQVHPNIPTKIPSVWNDYRGRISMSYDKTQPNFKDFKVMYLVRFEGDPKAADSTYKISRNWVIRKIGPSNGVKEDKQKHRYGYVYYVYLDKEGDLNGCEDVYQAAKKHGTKLVEHDYKELSLDVVQNEKDKKNYFQISWDPDRISHDDKVCLFKFMPKDEIPTDVNQALKSHKMRKCYGKWDTGIEDENMNMWAVVLSKNNVTGKWFIQKVVGVTYKVQLHGIQFQYVKPTQNHVMNIAQVTNGSANKVNKTVIMNFQQDFTEMWSTTSSTEINFSFDAGVPVFGNGTVTTSITNVFTKTFGKQKTASYGSTVKIEIPVSSKHQVECRGKMDYLNAKLPFTANKRVYYRHDVKDNNNIDDEDKNWHVIGQIHGLFEGTSVGLIEVHVGEEKPYINNEIQTHLVGDEKAEYEVIDVTVPPKITDYVVFGENEPKEYTNQYEATAIQVKKKELKPINKEYTL